MCRYRSSRSPKKLLKHRTATARPPGCINLNTYANCPVATRGIPSLSTAGSASLSSALKKQLLGDCIASMKSRADGHRLDEYGEVDESGEVMVGTVSFIAASPKCDPQDSLSSCILPAVRSARLITVGTPCSVGIPLLLPVLWRRTSLDSHRRCPVPTSKTTHDIST
jgi:hypothetical protein